LVFEAREDFVEICTLNLSVFRIKQPEVHHIKGVVGAEVQCGSLRLLHTTKKLGCYDVVLLRAREINRAVAFKNYVKRVAFFSITARRLTFLQLKVFKAVNDFKHV
jgi:hypothetical protein